MFSLPSGVARLFDVLGEGELPDGFRYKEAVMMFMGGVFLFETYLEFRQRKYLRKETVPDELSEVISDTSFKAARAYSLDKWNFSMFSSVFSLAEDMLVLQYDVMPLMWKWSAVPVAFLGLAAERTLVTEIARSVVFTVGFTIVQMLIKLPFSIYGTFYLEQRHGFNKTTKFTFVTDMIKSICLMVVFTPIIEGLIIPIITYGGKFLAIYLWAFMFALALVMMTIYPVLIAPLFNKYDPLEEGPLKQKIEALALKLEFPLTKLFVMDGSKRSGHSNAYMYGFFKNKRIVLFDTLLKQCADNDDEVVAVLAHELGHWKLGHTVFTFSTMQLITFLQFGVFTVVRNTPAIYKAFGFVDRPAIISLMLFQQIISPVDHVVGLLQNCLSRRFEFQADKFAVDLNYAKELRGGLIRLQEENKSSTNIDPWYSAYHHTHPPLVERLKALNLKKKE